MEVKDEINNSKIDPYKGMDIKIRTTSGSAGI